MSSATRTAQARKLHHCSRRLRDAPSRHRSAPDRQHRAPKMRRPANRPQIGAGLVLVWEAVTPLNAEIPSPAPVGRPKRSPAPAGHPKRSPAPAGHPERSPVAMTGCAGRCSSVRWLRQSPCGSHNPSGLPFQKLERFVITSPAVRYGYVRPVAWSGIRIARTGLTGSLHCRAMFGNSKSL